MKNSNALFFIQHDVHRAFIREFQSDSKVMIMKLQSLRCDFATSLMRNGESMQVFLPRVSAIVWLIRFFGEQLQVKQMFQKSCGD